MGAVQLFTESLRAEADVMTLFNRGCALSNAGKYREALQDLDKAVAHSPKHPFYLYQRAITLAKYGRISEAAQNFERALLHDPTNMDAFYNLVCAHVPSCSCCFRLACMCAAGALMLPLTDAHARTGAVQGGAGAARGGHRGVHTGH